METALAQLPAYARQTSFDDESIRKNEIDNYKPKEGHTDRIAILDPRMVVVARSHYGGEGVGYVLCQSQYEKKGGVELMTRKAACCEHMPEADLRIAVPIIKYDTKPNGEFVKPLSIQTFIWRINEDKFSQLRGIHKEWGLDKHDVIVNCTDEKYQKVSIQVARERVISNEDVRKKFSEQIESFAATVGQKLVKAIGKEMTEQALLEKLGKVTAGTTVAPSKLDAPVGDIKDLLG